MLLQTLLSIFQVLQRSGVLAFPNIEYRFHKRLEHIQIGHPSRRSLQPLQRPGIQEEVVEVSFCPAIPCSWRISGEGGGRCEERRRRFAEGLEDLLLQRGEVRNGDGAIEYQCKLILVP